MSNHKRLATFHFHNIHAVSSRFNYKLFHKRFWVNILLTLRDNTRRTKYKISQMTIGWDV